MPSTGRQHILSRRPPYRRPRRLSQHQHHNALAHGRRRHLPRQPHPQRQLGSGSRSLSDHHLLGRAHCHHNRAKLGHQCRQKFRHRRRNAPPPRGDQGRLEIHGQMHDILDSRWRDDGYAKSSRWSSRYQAWIREVDGLGEEISQGGIVVLFLHVRKEYNEEKVALDKEASETV